MSEFGIQRGLSYEEAVQVLGYAPGDLVEPHLPAFQGVERKLVFLIETSQDEQFRARLRGELDRLSEALRVLEAGPGPLAAAPRSRARVWMWVSVMLVGCFVGLAGIGNMWVMHKRGRVGDERIAALLADGDAALEKRRWPEARAIYDEILAARPGLAGAVDGLRRIEDGKAEERRQQVGFLMGTAQAAIEGRRWDEAESATRDLRTLDPENTSIATFTETIASGRTIDRIVGILDDAENAIRKEQWDRLASSATQLEVIAPQHVDLPRLKKLAAEGMVILEERRGKARELYRQALAMDDGTYSPPALEILREAMRLAERPEYRGLYDKISGYTRTLNVPGEFKTINEALTAARPKDEVRVAAGTYVETLVIPAEIQLEGDGPDKTIIECASSESSVLVVRSESRGSRVVGVTLRQTGIALTAERYPVVAIDAGNLMIDDCVIENGSGHGVAVVHGGEVQMREVEVRKCGWDGLAIYGEGSRGEAIGCRFNGNLHHGIDAWSGGGVTISKCRSSANGLAGIVMMSPGVLSEVEGTTCDENRELGVLVGAGAAAELAGNELRANLLGGLLVRDTGTTAVIVGNRIVDNGAAGVVIDKRSKVARFEDNEIRQNEGEQVKMDADLGEDEAAVPERGGTLEVVPPPEVPDDLAVPEEPAVEPDAEIPAPPPVSVAPGAE